LSSNIAHRLYQNSILHPDKSAVVFPIYHKNQEKYHYSSLTFKELEILSNKFAIGLTKLGLKKGDRTLLFLKPSLDFPAMVFALFKIGVVPVLIDPGMGKENLLKCIKETAPVALIAEEKVHFLKLFYPFIFKTIKINVTNGKWSLPKKTSISNLKKEKVQFFKTQDSDPSDTAAILFTSGGTGTPKGVIYTHRIFETQTNMLQEMYKLGPTDIDMPGFPLFSLFTIAMGITSCIPDMDPTKPGQCNPKKIVQNIIDQKPTFVAGSPAIWERVAQYCIEHSITLPSIKYVVMFGAPVATRIHRKFKGILPNGTTYTPYGATESLPVCNISGEFILKYTSQLSESGAGTCVGLPAPGVQIKIIQPTNSVISKIENIEEMKTNHVGEIIVKGPTTTAAYMDLPDKTLEAKIYENDGSFWHRMGDVGYIDKNGFLWFCGRKSHVVKTKEDILYPIPCEAIFNNHPAVRRSALVGLGEVGNQIPAIVIERKDGQYLTGKARSIFESELFSLAKKYPHTKDIKKIYLSKTFPVDVRHNIKIDRLKLKEEIEAHEIN
jgi:acyl-CoA synthetase (AMP-forming)/AMP-acid ligase II